MEVTPDLYFDEISILPPERTAKGRFRAKLFYFTHVDWYFVERRNYKVFCERFNTETDPYYVVFEPNPRKAALQRSKFLYDPAAYERAPSGGILYRIAILLASPVLLPIYQILEWRDIRRIRLEHRRLMHP